MASARTPVRRTALRFSNTTTNPLGKITVAGLGVFQKKALFEPRIFGQYALVYILDGKGRYWDANGQEQDLGPGDAIFVFPELEHIYNPVKGQSWVTTFICFEGPVFDLWRSTGILDSRRPVHHLEPVDVWGRRIESILGPARRTGFAPPLLEVCRLQELLAAIWSGEGQAQIYQDDLRWAQRACSLIEAELGGDVDWHRVAHQFGLTLEGFRKRFTRLTDQTPAYYLMGRRIDRACEFMQQGGFTDKEIADRLGFCDEYYFSRRFKEITGKSPRTFRKNLSL